MPHPAFRVSSMQLQPADLAPWIWLCGLRQVTSLWGPRLSHLYNGPFAPSGFLL